MTMNRYLRTIACMFLLTNVAWIVWALSADAATVTVTATGAASLSASSPSGLASAPTSGRPYGSTAWVANQGNWTYVPCPPTCDGTSTCVFAGGQDAGQSGCWVRGTGGFPGSTYITDWYINTANSTAPGSDANDCQATGASRACLTLDEIVRRAKSQPPPPTFALVTVHVSGDLLGNQKVDFPTGWVVEILGTRKYNGSDGGAYYSGKVTAVQSWASTTHPGIVTVGPSVDGGAAFNPTTFASVNGYFLEVQDGGSSPGLSIPIGAQADAGTFYTSFGLDGVGSYTTDVAPVVGDPVAIYKPSGFASDDGSQAQVIGAGAIFADLLMGNLSFGAESVNVNPINGVTNAVEFDSCIAYSPYIMAGSYLFSYGSVFANGIRVTGGQLFDNASHFDGLYTRELGQTFLAGNSLIGSFTSGGFGSVNQVIFLGSSDDGPGFLTVEGKSAVVDYFGSAGLTLRQGGSSAYIDAPLLFLNSVGSQAAIDCGSGTKVIYTSGNTPTVSGTTVTNPYIVGGTGSPGPLPVASGNTKLAGITQE